MTEAVRQAPTDSSAQRAALLRWGGGVALISVAVLVVVLLVGGGAPQAAVPGLPDPGPITGWGLPLSRLLADLAGLATIGLLLAAAVLLPSPADRLAGIPARGVRLAGVSAAVWAGAVFVELVFNVSDFLGISPQHALRPTVFLSFVTQVTQGRALLIQVVLALAVAAMTKAVVNSFGASVVTVLALSALVPPLLTGHAASAGSHELAIASLVVHVVCVALWVGGLLALAWAALAGTEGLRHAVPRFSTLAAWCFTIIGVSGVVNAAVRLGAFAPLITSSYGALVLAKATALVVLGGFGYWHRARTVRQLAAGEESSSGRRAAALAFLSVAAAELVVMAATVALAVGLSRSPTPSAGGESASAAADILGFPLPGPPTAARFALG
ncbi:MAG: CopD family protein, partial [Mycobacteriales bacterium]